MKMLLKKNFLDTFTLVSCCGSLICLLLNMVIIISPLKGVWFPMYSFVVFFVSLTCSFRFIQWLLHLNKPLKYDFERLAEDYPCLSPIIDFVPKPKPSTPECKEYDTNELSVITTVLERKLVSSWYNPFVSQEIGFPFACKQLLDQIVGKGFQISNKIDTKEVYIDVCTIFTMHLKEYKKALKRQEKSPEKDVESLYKITLFMGGDDKNYTAAEHFTDVLRVIIKELVPWELWDTPHSELLIRILAKKLDHYIDNTLADPTWLNDKLLNALQDIKEPNKDLQDQQQNNKKQKIQTETKDSVMTTEKTNEVSEDTITLQEKDSSEPEKEEPQTIESALSLLINQTTAPILKRPLNSDLDETFHHDSEIDEEISEIVQKLNGSEPIDIQSSPVMRQRRGRHGRNEVKIYDRVIEGSVKTWESVGDLGCVSVGTDLLNALGEEIRLSRLWDDEGRGEHGMGIGEEDFELDSKETSPVKKDIKDSSPVKKEIVNTSPVKKEIKNSSPVKKEMKDSIPRPELSPKPTEALLKDIQSTVHQAKTKIGDLQVTGNDLNVEHDEAAGMMEGLLDFGIAGLRKGLRLTGLSDEMDKSPKDITFEKYSPLIERHKLDTTVTTSGLHREENGVSSVPPLVKQQRVASQDSVSLSRPRPRPPPLPPLPPEPAECPEPAAESPEPALPSPEPEYEEAEDLSTTIAKLRSLLQQRERSEVWWDSAEETRGRTQGHHSSRAVDTATVADEYDHSTERSSPPIELNQATNNMQRFDKFLNRAVTGVFNSILTAVAAGPGPDAGPGPAAEPTARTLAWEYQPTLGEHTVSNAVARLVSSRRAYNHVDAALDSLEQLPASKQTMEASPEDFEEWCCSVGSLWCAGAELLAAAGVITSHAAYRAAALLLADVSIPLITSYLAGLTALLRKQVFVLFEQLNEPAVDQNDLEELRPFRIEETCQAVLEAVPAPLQVLGEENLSNAAHLLISSVSHKQLNKLLFVRLLDVLALHFHTAASTRETSFDAGK